MDPKIRTLLEHLAELNDEQLTELNGVLLSNLEAAAEEKDVEAARFLGDGIQTVRAEVSRREEEAAARDAEIAEILSRVNPVAETDPDDDNPDDDVDDDDSSSEEPVEPELVPAPDPEPIDEPAENKVAAATRAPLPKINIAALATKRRKEGATPAPAPAEPAAEAASVKVVAMSEGGGIASGADIDREELRRLIVSKLMTQFQGRTTLATITTDYPEDRLLHPGDVEGNWAKIEAVTSPRALVAAGGICAPLQGLYDAITLATDARPIRDGLPRFGADRGGIRYIPPSSISDVTGAITHITNDQDASGTTKDCLTITCNDIVEATINAIARCLQFGNFNARTHPEYVNHIIDLTLAAWARTAESNLWETMCDASTAVTGAENLGAWRDLYGIVARAVTFYRSRHRMSPSDPFRLMAPFWLADMLSVDMNRQLPGDNANALPRSQFSSWLGNLNVNVSWTLEGGTNPTQVFGAQGAGPLDGWPDTTEMLLFPEGSFLYLDGGTLDLGIVRDSTLNVTNDFQIFAEGFETVAFMGVESYCLTADLCPSGISAGQEDTPFCPASGPTS